MIEILKLRPRTNCRDCGMPTSMVFAARMEEGIKGVEDCPGLDQDNRTKLVIYIQQFVFDV